MTVASVITYLAALQDGITGVEAAYDETPESLSEFPCFINYPGRGVLSWSKGIGAEDLNTIICELHVSRAVSEEAEFAARPFIERFRDKLAADTQLGGEVDTINEVRWEYVTFFVGREQHMGIRFEVDVKMSDPTITVSA